MGFGGCFGFSFDLGFGGVAAFGFGPASGGGGAAFGCGPAAGAVDGGGGAVGYNKKETFSVN